MPVKATYRFLTWGLLLLPIYLFLFVKLGTPAIRLWDEGWFAVHAFEMMERGSWFTVYFDGQPSVTSSKPPLQTWLQILSMKWFGVNELALRLPSAMAAGISVVVLFFYTKKFTNETVSWLSALVLLTSVGYIGFHTARGAEADSLLTLLLLLQSIMFFQFFKTRRKKYLWLVALFIALGFWAKSMATFLLLPGMFAFSFIVDRSVIFDALRTWQFYAALLLATLSILSYVFLRESLQPGYLDMFFRSNVGRYASTVGHDQPFLYYIRHFLFDRYAYWIGFSLFGIALALLLRKTVAPWIVYNAIMALVFVLIITAAKSKLPWYDMPFYPLASVPVAFSIDQLLKSQRGIRRTILLIALFILPMYHMFAHTQANRLSLEEMRFESQEIFLARSLKQQKMLDQTKVVHDHFHGALLFYQHAFKVIGQQIYLQNHLDGITPGDQVLMKKGKLADALQERYELDSLSGYHHATLYRIKNIKPSNP